MKIHEYQGKEILRKYGVATLRGRLSYTPDEAEAAARELATPVVVVKAQIHAGGRGKGGGVKLAKSPAEAKARAAEILGMMLKTPQTGPEGQKVRKVLVEEGCAIARELYLGMVLDRDTSTVTLMASTEGGVEIEEVAHHHPEKILKASINPLTGLNGFQARDIAFALGLEGKAINKFVGFAQKLYEAFIGEDASLAEINPMVLTKDGDIVALDAKFNFDDNALFRREDIVKMRDLDEEDPKEIEAKKWDLSYIALDGSIGCLVNGAGLAMATMDVIKLKGSFPANFLDVGGGATAEKVTAAFKIILSDHHVKGILVNIFGGIMKCDTIAAGIIAATKEVNPKVPIVVRLEGTNVELGKKMLSESGLALIPANDLTDAAEKIVAATKNQ
jgi:succinyl-CoA synthetase beta subunit